MTKLTDNLPEGIYLDDAFDALVRSSGVTFPHELVWGAHGLQDFRKKHLKDKAGWDKVSWNPIPVEVANFHHHWSSRGGGRYGTGEGKINLLLADPNASPKPTYEALVQAYWTLKVSGYNAGWAKEVDIQYRRRYARDHEPEKLSVDVAGVGSVSGIEALSRMASVSYMAQASGLAGGTFPRVVLQHRDTGNPLHVWLSRDAHQVLTQQARVENEVEGAKALIKHELETLEAIVLDTDADLEDRAQAEKKIEHIWRNYSDHVDKNRKKVSSLEEWPTDLETVKEKALELLEGAAMGHIKYLKFAISQQGSDLPPACTDADDAEKKVAAAEKNAALLVAVAADVSAAKSAYNAGVEAIRAVKAVNTPAFTNPGGVVLGDKHNVVGKSVVLTAHQPEGVPGGAVIIVNSTPGGVGLADHSVNPPTLTLSLDEGRTEPLTFVAYARNICGPTRIEVTLSPNRAESDLA